MHVILSAGSMRKGALRFGCLLLWLSLLLGMGLRGVAWAGNRAQDEYALRIHTAGPGLYRLTHAALAATGLALPAQAGSFALSCGGEFVGLDFQDEDGERTFTPGDSLVFYGQAYADRYQTGNVCFLAWQPGMDVHPNHRAMPRRSLADGGDLPLTTRITRTLTVERNLPYHSTYPLASTEDHWFDLPLVVNSANLTASRSYTFPLSLPLPGPDEARLTLRLFGGITSGGSRDQAVDIFWNDIPLATARWTGNSPYTLSLPLSADWLQSENQLTLLAARQAISGADAFWISPDWLSLDYSAVAQAQDDRLLLLPDALSRQAMRVAVSGFSGPDLLAYAIDDPTLPQRLTDFSPQPGVDGYGLALPVGPPGTAYALARGDALLSPRAIAVKQPSAWATPNHQADYIAIVHSAFWEAIDPLLAHRQQEGMAIAKVHVQDIYDEFAFGRTDPEAIRSFLTYAYHHWNQDGPRPRFVLLVGDGHYDFRGDSGTSLLNFIPPYLVAVDPWLGETAADNRYVSIDGPDDYLPNMHIGRIPANTPGDVTAVVEKILAYENGAGDAEWRRRAVFVADAADDPAYNFHTVSDEMSSHLPQPISPRRIYYGPEYPSGEAMRTAIRNAFDSGALLLQWFGHASRFRWGSVSMFNINDVPALAANASWPITFDYSCWSGYFINLIEARPALAEALLLTPGRGSVATLAPSGLHVGDALRLLNLGIFEAIFTDKIDRLGPAIDQGRAYYLARSDGWHDVIDTSVLFGDPALKLRLPDGAVLSQPPVYLPQIQRNE